MKTDGTTEILPLSKKQKYACNIIMGVLLVAAGLIIMLAGVGAIDVPVGMIAAPALLYGFGLAILISALISRNSVSMWLAGVILTCGTATLLDSASTATYSNLYPMFIAAPGVGCVLAMVFSEYKFSLLKGALFFGGLAAVFSLSSSGLCGWGLTGGLLAAFAGVCIILYAVFANINKDKNNA